MKNRSSEPIEIDREKLRDEIRKLRTESIFYMLDDAIDLLPPSKLRKIAKKYIDLERIRPNAETLTKENLLTKVKAFEKASLAGDYYESFNVNSKNFTEKSTGTITWIATYLRHLDGCVTKTRKANALEVRKAMDILFGLLDYIDECRLDIIFFADEGGSWQVGVDWDSVLPAWFKVLSATAEPEDYAKRIIDLITRHYNYDRDKMLSRARRMATPEQRKALIRIEREQESKR